MLYDYIIIYDYKAEGNTTACIYNSLLRIVPLKGHLCTLFTPKKFHIGTNVHLFEYKLQRYPYKGTVVYIFQIVFCVCCMYSTWHTVMDTCTFTYFFILFCYTVIT